MLAEPLSHLSSIVPDELTNLRRHLMPEWIEAALAYTGTRTLRRRRLPAEQVVWLVIGMALMRNRSIYDVVTKLDLALPASSATVAPSSVAQARARVGAEPLKWLFETSARAWAHECARTHAWRGLALYGVDGSSFRVQDSAENAAFFGRPGCGKGQSGYPVMRFAAAVALRSHLIAATAFGPYRMPELSLAAMLWADIPDHSLTIVDKNFLSAKTLRSLTESGRERNWLIRAKKNTKWKVIERYSETDSLVEMRVPPRTRAKDPTLPATWRARAIHYQIRGFRPATLLTSLVDYNRYPAEELVGLYCERWEHEQAYDELKTEMLAAEATLRSKTPPAVEQELWGVLIAFNLVRREILAVADEAGVEPTRISFVAVYRLICDEWLWCAIASPGAIPRHLHNLRGTIRRFVLPERRPRRTYPRVVKARLHKYPTRAVLLSQ